MALVLKLDNPNIPKGEQVGIDGLGILTNGETSEFTDQEVLTFKEKNAELTYESTATGVTVTSKRLRIDTLINRAAFVTIEKNSNPDSDSESEEDVDADDDKNTDTDGNDE